MAFSFSSSKKPLNPVLKSTSKHQMKAEEDNNELNRRFGIKRKEPFQSPEGYFENFNTRLRDRMSAPVKTKQTRFAIPALAAVVGVITIVFMVSRPSEVKQDSMDNITYQELAESTYLYTISEEEIAEAYSTMFHGTHTQDDELEYILGELDEETLSINL